MVNHPGDPGGNPGGPPHRNLQTTPRILNPRFDPRIRAIGSAQFAPRAMKRGWIQTTESPNGQGSFRVNFLFNPSTVVVNSDINPTLPSPQQRKSNDNRVAGDQPFFTSTGSSIGFSLLFDRTYEVWSQPGGQPTLASTFGVDADIAAFYYYFGMITEEPTAAVTHPGHISLPGEPAPPVTLQNWTRFAPSQPPFYFGSQIYIGDKMYFYGAATTLNVTYTHWTNQMVPSRCSVDLSFQLLADPAYTDKLVNNNGLNGIVQGAR